MVKAAVERKEVLGARDEVKKERCMESYREAKKKVKRCIYQNKKVNQDVDGNRKLFWEKVS